MKIVVRTPNWLGDCIMALPVFRELRKKFPEAEIVAACRKNVADCYNASSYVDRVILAPGKKVKLSEYFNSIKKLRAEKFDIGVLTTNSFGTALWFFLGRVKRRLGFARDARKMLLTDAFIPTTKILTAHQSDYYLYVLNALEIEAQAGLPKLEVSASAKQEAEKVLEELGLKDEEYAVIAPLSAYGSVKDWGNDKYAAVAARITEEFGIKVFITGTAAQAGITETISDVADGVYNLAGKVSLAGFMAVLKGAALYVGGDSGGAHTAAALDVPTVTIFGITEPSRTKALGRYVAIVGEGGMCTPDLKNPEVRKAARKALDAITPEMIIQRSWELLDKVSEEGL